MGVLNLLPRKQTIWTPYQYDIQENHARQEFFLGHSYYTTQFLRETEYQGEYIDEKAHAAQHELPD